jgi:hypothetical protein
VIQSLANRHTRGASVSPEAPSPIVLVPHPHRRIHQWWLGVSLTVLGVALLVSVVGNRHWLGLLGMVCYAVGVICMVRGVGRRVSLPPGQVRFRPGTPTRPFLLPLGWMVLGVFLLVLGIVIASVI